MNRLPYIAVLFAAVLLVAADKKTEKAKEPVPSSTQIQKWIKQLGDDDFKVREEATRNLINAGGVAFDAVAKATNSEDAEVKQRALKIFRQLKLKSAADYIKRGNSFYKDGKYDSAIADYTKALAGVEELRKQVNRFETIKAEYYYRDLIISKRKRILLQGLRITETNLEKAESTRTRKFIQENKEFIEKINSILGQTKIQLLKEGQKVRGPLRLNVEAYNKRGFAWKKKGDRVKADSDFEKAKELEALNIRAFKQEGVTEIITALKSKSRNSTDVALWTLENNKFKNLEIDFGKPYSTAEPKLKALIETLRKLSGENRAKIDESFDFYHNIYRTKWASGSEPEGWRD